MRWADFCMCAAFWAAGAGWDDDGADKLEISICKGVWVNMRCFGLIVAGWSV